MKQVLLLYRFNPYRNRRIIRYTTVEEYIGNPNNESGHINAGSYLSVPYPVNFAYRDGVNTSMKVNLGGWDTPDYLLIISRENNQDIIESRWFVMDADFRSGNLAELQLRRDMIADYYSEVLEAPCFIEKATLNASDPFIFNAENITVNEIKKSEELLQDRSKCAWVVGYINPTEATAGTITSKESIDIDGSYANAQAFEDAYEALGVYDYIKFPANSQGLPTASTQRARVSKSYGVILGINRTNYVAPELKQYGKVYYIWSKGGTISRAWYYTYNNVSELQDPDDINVAPYKTTIPGLWNSITNNRIKNDLAEVQDQLESGLDEYFSLHGIDAISIYDGKQIKIGNTYYKLNVRQYYDEEEQDPETIKINTTTNNAIVNAINSMSCWDSVDNVTTDNGAWAAVLDDKYEIVAEEISTAELNITLTGDERACAKLPYKVFCLPYSREGAITVHVGLTTITMAGDLALSVAKAISVKYTGANQLYDVQLLPYCPDQSIIKGEREITFPSGNSKTTFIKNENDINIGALYWVPNNTGSFDITKNISVNNVKVESITEKYRISSPNWNGQFEFNPAKNGGVSKFNIDYTYKPHTPYIHINPDFGRLYGEDFDDARGLICSGDYSLPQTSNAWNTYEIQNKNYQNQFQRDIDNLELTQSIQMKQQIAGAITGAVGGAISGGATGAAVGGLPGMLIGGAVGAGMSAIGAGLDVKYQKQLNEEAIDYRRDQFGFQLENIKALPQNLTNVGAMTANNKLWPVLEHYSCTNEEKQALVDKLYYNGMTVNRIGTMADFLQPDYSYIKGKLIRLTIDEDNHFIESIANEIDRGVFIK